MKKAVLAAVAATLLIALTTGSAAALRSLEYSATLLSLLDALLTILGILEAVCEVGITTTLTKRASPKTGGGIIGRASSLVLRCSRGTLSIVNPPWNVKYVSIGGTLPRISSFTFEIERVQLRATNILTCQITAEVSGLDRVTAETGVVGNFEGRPFRLRAVTTSGACEAGEVALLGTFTPTNGPITARLI